MWGSCGGACGGASFGCLFHRVYLDIQRSNKEKSSTHTVKHDELIYRALAEMVLAS